MTLVSMNRAGSGPPPPVGVRTGGMSSMTAWNMLVSLTLAAVTAPVSGTPLPSQTRWSLLPGLPRSTDLRPRAPSRLARMLMVSTLARSPSSRPCSPRRSRT
jgi:hypothetical protein